MTDKMREAFEKWAYNKLNTSWKEGDRYSISRTQVAWEAWQAATAAQSEPVVGEVVAWRWRYAQKSEEALATACFGKPQWESDKVFDGIPSDEAIQRALLKGVVPEYLYRKPTHSITAAELERLRRIEAVMIKVSDLRFDRVTLPIIREMIDAAIAAEGEKE